MISGCPNKGIQPKTSKPVLSEQKDQTYILVLAKCPNKNSNIFSKFGRFVRILALTSVVGAGGPCAVYEP